MRDTDDHSEEEPLVPQEEIRESNNSSSSSKLYFPVIPQPFHRNPKSLEITAVFVVAFDTTHGWFHNVM